MLAGQAGAADVVIDPQRFSGGNYDWSGFFVGASIAHTTSQDDDPRFQNMIGFTLHSEGDNDNFGFHAGVMQQFGSFVLGAEYEYRYLDIQYSRSAIGPLPVWLTNSHAGYARFGVAVDTVQFYGIAGTRWADTNVGLNDFVIAYGGGVDWAPTEPLIVGLRYDRSDFSNFDNTGIKGDLQQLSARFGFKF